MSEVQRLGLFEGYGVEIEYMLVDRETLVVLPQADRVLEVAAGEVVSEVEMGELAWSNELVLHVIELKTNGPARSLPSAALTAIEPGGTARQVEGLRHRAAVEPQLRFGLEEGRFDRRVRKRPRLAPIRRGEGQRRRRRPELSTAERRAGQGEGRQRLILRDERGQVKDQT